MVTADERALAEARQTAFFIGDSAVKKRCRVRSAFLPDGVAFPKARDAISHYDELWQNAPLVLVKIRGCFPRERIFGDELRHSGRGSI
jgi:hypothetical protein